MKKPKAGYTTRHCPNLWVLCVEDSRHLALQAPPTRLLSIYGPSGAHPSSLISRTTSTVFSLEPQHRLGNMGVKLLGCLLLLGLVIMVDKALFQTPPRLTPSQWFKIQHIDMTSPRCTVAMRRVNRYTRQCKNLNTFLHTKFANVVRVCGRRNTTCRNGRRNCHDSLTPVSLTICNLTTPGSHYTQCRYQKTRARKFYRVACDNRTAQDNGTYPVVPVHLDWIF
ncbi:eosinophil cationic protein-like [Sigmodon hispidus]